MPKRYSTFLFFLLAGAVYLLNACAGETGAGGKYSKEQLEEQQNLWNAVMSIHDPIMARMGDINRMTGELQGILDSNVSLQDSMKQKIEETIGQLNAADEDMMDWMNTLRQLDDLRMETSHTSILQYLKDRERAIKKVQGEVLVSIEEGQKLLDNFAGQ